MSSMESLSSLDQSDDVLEQGYDEYFDPPAPDSYECPICLLVLRKPMQTECGHRFCRGCILKAVREGRPNCPIDNEALSESQIFPDNFARREILILTVRCINHTAGCDWKDSLRELPKHVGQCDFGMVNCPNKCNVKVLRNELEKHTKEKCVHRIVTCPHCKMKMVFRQVDEHNERCTMFPVNCPNECGTLLVREQLADHLEKECPNSVRFCPFKDAGCQFMGSQTDISKHMNNPTNNHMENMLELVRTLTNRVEENEAYIKKLSSSDRCDKMDIDQDMLEISKLPSIESCSSTSSQSLDNPKMTAKVKELELKVVQCSAVAEMFRSELKQISRDMHNKLETMQQSINEHTTMINDISARVWCGKFIWRITNFEQLFNQAKRNELPAIHSLPFYTAVPGYKMCLRVNLNGIDSGSGSHVSMFVHLMQGDFDSFIDWPFPHSLELTIMDQSPSNPQHIKETLHTRPTLQAFLRPKTPRNHKGYGYVEMIPHLTLRQRGYLQNDTMIVRVDVK